MTSWTPTPASASAHAATVAPVVKTSSTRRTRRGTRAGRRSGSNAPRMAARRSSPGRRACGVVATDRRMSRRTGRPSRSPTGPASARDWSYPRSASRRRASGTHVTASAAGGPTATIASASAAATLRHPENFNRWIAARAGPAYRNGERATLTGGGGQSRQRSTATGPGRPHRSHHGGPSASSAARHPSQNGQLPTPQPAHRGGNTTSSARATTARRYKGPPTRDICRDRRLGQIQLDRGGKAADVDA
jgi:hypothetical protein